MQLTGRRTAQLVDNKGLVGIVLAALVIAAIVAALAFESFGLARSSTGVGPQTPAGVTQALPGSHPWITPDGRDGSLASATGSGSQVWITPDGQDAYRAAPSDPSSRRMIAD